MGKGLVGPLQEDQNDAMGTAAGYEEGSEEEPYEREFYDDVDDEHCDGAALSANEDASDEEPYEVEFLGDEGSGKGDSSCSEPYISLVPNGHSSCRKQLYDTEPHHRLIAREDEFVEKSNYVQPVKKEQNEQDLKEVLMHSNSVHKEVMVTKDKEIKPFKKRLSVKFAADVSCYTYNTESFAAASLEKRKAQFDDQDKYPCKRQEQSLPLPSPQDGGKLNEGDDTNLFVGNLPLSMVSHKLLELFLPFGRIVRSRVVDDCFTGLSKGYGFVKYSNPHSAAEAIKRMNGRMVGGKMLEVRVADSSGFNPSVPSVPEIDQPAKEMDMRNLYVCNLPSLMNANKLHDLFVPYGQVTDARVARDQTTGLSKGFGFVKYSDLHDAARAVLQLNGCLVEGKKIEVRVAGTSSPGSYPSVHAVSETDHQPSKEMDLSNLYVCNLPLLMNTDKLLSLFAPYGEVKIAKVAMDYTAGISKGYGFVKFSDPHDAAHAVIQLNGRLIEGKKIGVHVSALSQRPSTSPVESHSDHRTLKDIDMCNIYVCNIPSSMNTAKLVELFLPFGKITHARVVEKNNNSSKRYGFIKFGDSKSATEAIALMNGALIEGETLLVRVAGLSPSASSLVSRSMPHSVTNLSTEINKSRLYITNIPLSITADKLVSLFTPFGQINRVVMNVEYSLVFYADMDSVTKAITRMDGYLIEGKRLVVKNSESCPANASDYAFSQSGSRLMKEIDMANLYVGNVPSAVTCDQLIELFHPFGEIIQARKFNIQGYGMIRYANPSSATAAIDHLDGYQIGGSTLVVRVAGLRAGPDATTNAPTMQMHGNEHRQIDMTNLYVCHLPLFVTTEKLVEIFLPCGQITQAKVVVDRVTGISKGFGFVKFADAYSAAVALTHMNHYPLEGHMLEVRIAGVAPKDMSSYMAHFYSHFTPDPSRMAVGIPTSYWPYYYAESAYSTAGGYQGQGVSATYADQGVSATYADQTSRLEDLPGSEPVGSVAERNCSSLSNYAASDSSQLEGWAGPPGFEPHAVAKKDATES